MLIHIARNGVKSGPFALDEVNRQLGAGTLHLTDLAWYEGAVGWAALSTIPGVSLPVPQTTAVSQPLPAPTPEAVPLPAPVSASPVSSVPVPTFVPPRTIPVQRSYKGLSITSWLLLAATVVISVIPVVGFGSWILVWPVAIATIIMGIMVITRGGTVQGIMILIASVLLIPAVLLVPVVTTAGLGAYARAGELKKEKQIAENLDALAAAKEKWAAANNRAAGATVGREALTPYLGGKSVSPVVGESYQVNPVGVSPTATLPADKTFSGYKKGTVIMSNGGMLAEATTPVLAASVPPIPSASPEVSKAPRVSPSPRRSSSRSSAPTQPPRRVWPPTPEQPETEGISALPNDQPDDSGDN